MMYQLKLEDNTVALDRSTAEFLDDVVYNWLYGHHDLNNTVEIEAVDSVKMELKFFACHIVVILSSNQSLIDVITYAEDDAYKLCPCNELD